jgi:hypothetical protein
MLFKMFGIERAWELRGSNDARPRQLFITKSRNLAEEVEGYFYKLIQSIFDEEDTPKHIADMLERQNARGDRGLARVSQESGWRQDLPGKYSELTEMHFPLFITVDTVSAFLLLGTLADGRHPSAAQLVGSRFVSSYITSQSSVEYNSSSIIAVHTGGKQRLNLHDF